MTFNPSPGPSRKGRGITLELFAWIYFFDIAKNRQAERLRWESGWSLLRLRSVCSRMGGPVTVPLPFPRVRGV